MYLLYNEVLEILTTSAVTEYNEKIISETKMSAVYGAMVVKRAVVEVPNELEIPAVVPVIVGLEVSAVVETSVKVVSAGDVCSGGEKGEDVVSGNDVDWTAVVKDSAMVEVFTVVS